MGLKSRVLNSQSASSRSVVTPMCERRIVPPVPPTQAKQSTFVLPPLDGSLSIPELIDHNVLRNGKHHFFLYPEDNGTLRTVSWSEAGQAMLRYAGCIRQMLGWTPGTYASSAPVISIVAHSDALPYATMVFGIMRAGFIPFPISPRNSPAAVAALLASVPTMHLLQGQDDGMKELVRASFAILAKEYPNVRVPPVSLVPSYEDLYPPTLDTDPRKIPFEFTGPDATVLMVHTSGSIAYPKPVTWSHHRFLKLGIAPFFGEQDLTGKIVGIHGAPMFHGMGLCQVVCAISVGLVLSSFPPNAPLQTLTPEGLIHGLKACGCDIVLCVPAFIEAWAKIPEHVEYLRTMSGGIQFTGGALEKATGDFIVSEGIKIFVLYGASETGILSFTLPGSVDEDWDWFQIMPIVEQRWEPKGDGIFELVVMATEFYEPFGYNTTIDGIPAYATSDLFEKHPSKEGRWRVYGRADDQIIHNTGEKTNPVPMERVICQDPRVLGAVVFGSQRFQAGVIIDPQPHLRFDPSDVARLAEFKNMIWATVDQANKLAPQHSRLFKESIIVANPEKPWAYTPKMLPRRHAVIADYCSEIDNMYREVELSRQPGSEIASPDSWDFDSMRAYVRNVVQSVLVAGKMVGDEDDLFQRGCDSLQAMWIRRSLLHGVHSSKMPVAAAALTSTRNIVYAHPTIKKLARYLFQLVNTGSVGGESVVEHMRKMVNAYTQGLNSMPPTITHTQEQEEHTILVTGTTGSLGAHLLSKLLGDPNVRRIIAFNRPQKGVKLLERQKASLEKRGLDPSFLDYNMKHGKLHLVEGDLAISNFGLGQGDYDELRSSVTGIIHNAWTVDFNLSLSSFEPQIEGVRRLIDLASTAAVEPKPQITFVSSIGVVAGGNPSEGPANVMHALMNGYTQSKWVAEELLRAAHDQAGLPCTVVRVGQLTGGLNGAWNTNEWVPAVVHSASVVKCLPDSQEPVTWVPVDVAAEVIVEVALERTSGMHFGHLVHPNPVPWSNLAQAMGSELGVPLVSFEEWRKRLETHEDHSFPNEVPALKLGELWSGAGWDTLVGGRVDATGLPRRSSKLRELETLSCKDVLKWIGYWRRVGFLA